MTLSLSNRWFLPFVAAGFLAACGEEPEDTPDTLLPNRPDDKLIEETGQPNEISTDRKPEAGTSGEIPGYEPLETNDGNEEAN